MKLFSKTVLFAGADLKFPSPGLETPGLET